VYRHLMVPVDDSVLSSFNAEVAVKLAQRLGSRITFFHASADLGATRAGARLKSSDPRALAEFAFRDSHAMLVK
jgi:nucleotide-binding universal stress UspA family protein